MQDPLRLPHKTAPERPKVVQTCGALNTFGFKMCLMPPWRALFDIISTSKSGLRMVSFTFCLGNFPNVIRRWCALYILTWLRASRHNSVQLFISHLARWLRTCRFSEPTCRPFGATGKTQCLDVFGDLLLFSRICILL